MNRGFVFIFRLAVHGTRMKKILAAFILGMGCMLAVQAQQHPCVYVSPADRASVLQKVKNEPWAGEAFAAIRSKVEKYVDRHQTDPEWIISRLAMYWKRWRALYSMLFEKTELGLWRGECSCSHCKNAGNAYLE